MSSRLRSLVRYLVAAGLAGGAVAVKLLPAPIGRESPFLLLNAAVLLAAWQGGRGPALLAVMLAAAAADILFLHPYATFTRTEASTVQRGFFLMEALTVGTLMVSMKEARSRERRACAAADAERRRFESVVMQRPSPSVSTPGRTTSCAS
jgi:K+-sensing histidine kinase KdpD